MALALCSGTNHLWKGSFPIEPFGQVHDIIIGAAVHDIAIAILTEYDDNCYRVA